MIPSFSYIRFLLLSKRRHGLHSPFVYSYVSKCLIRCTGSAKNKTARVVLESVAYFNARRLLLHPLDSNLKETIAQDNVYLTFDIPPFDLIYLTGPDEPLLHSETLTQCIHNDTPILVDHIHNSPDSTRLWEALYLSERFTVTLDLYHCGILFIREGQSKQHFRIRI